jgi:hypothetical protein
MLSNASQAYALGAKHLTCCTLVRIEKIRNS